MDSDDGDDDDEHQAAVACGKDSAITHIQFICREVQTCTGRLMMDEWFMFYQRLYQCESMEIEKRGWWVWKWILKISLGFRKPMYMGFFALLYTLARRNHPWRRIRLSSVWMFADKQFDEMNGQTDIYGTFKRAVSNTNFVHSFEALQL